MSNYEQSDDSLLVAPSIERRAREGLGTAARVSSPSSAPELARYSGGLPRTETAYLGSSWLLTVFEATLIVMVGVASGVAYSMAAFGVFGSLHAFSATAVLVAVLFSGSMRIIAGGRRLRTRFIALRDDVLAWISVFLLLAFFAFSMKVGESFSRGAVLTFFFAGFVAVELFRSIAPRLVYKYYGRTVAWNDVLLVGDANANGLRNLRHDVASAGFPFCSVVTIDGTCSDECWPSELSGGISRILDLARTSRYGEIYVAAEGFRVDRLSDLTSGLQLVPRAVRLVPDPTVARLLLMPVHTIGRSCAIELQKSPLSRFQWLLKRTIDLVFAIPALLILGPLICSIAIAIKLDTAGPIIFRQKRLGYRSRPFDIFKFRTMTVLEDGETVQQARKGDQRVTKVGRFLRRTSLDELPQLVNVIIGDMSFVGPRPHARLHDALYTKLIENYELRQHVKPGITGWAQVNGLRGETSDLELMRRRVEYDIWYAKNASIAFDIAILLRTTIEVFRQRNAY